jgi:hypothetical protein
MPSEDMQKGPAGHRLTGNWGTESALIWGTCECGWTSAKYGLKATLKRAHDVHLDQQVAGREETHEEAVSRFFHDMVFGKTPVAS